MIQERFLVRGGAWLVLVLATGLVPQDGVACRLLKWRAAHLRMKQIILQNNPFKGI